MPQTDYKISVIVTIYNIEEYLAECIESLTHQSYQNLEFILVNDGSTDSCQAICDHYAGLDRRIQVITKPNGGVSAARNTGLQRASGEYVTFVDGDDYLDPDAYQIVNRRLQQEELDMVVFGVYKMRGTEKKTHLAPEDAVYQFENGKDLSDYYKEEFFPYRHGHEVWNKVYKKSVIDSAQLEFTDTGSVASEDMLFTMQMLAHLKKFASIPNPLYYYRERNQSIMNSGYRERLNERFCCLIATAETYYTERGFDLSDEMAAQFFLMFVAALYNEETGKKQNGVKQNLFRYPFDRLFRDYFKKVSGKTEVHGLLLASGISTKTLLIYRCIAFCQAKGVWFLANAVWNIFFHCTNKG